MGKVLGYLRLLLLILTLLICMIILVPGHLFFRFSKGTLFEIRRLFCKVAFLIMGLRVKKVGDLKVLKSPAIIVCNHRSLLDPFICARYVNGYFLSKAEIADYPVFGYGARLTGTLFVHREEASSRKAIREAMKEVLIKGDNVLLYPEGTTNGLEVTKDFYKGSFEIADELGVPVVPMVVEYRNKGHYWTDGPLLATMVSQLSAWRVDIGVWIGGVIEDGGAMEKLSRAKSIMDTTILDFHRDWRDAPPL